MLVDSLKHAPLLVRENSEPAIFENSAKINNNMNPDQEMNTNL